MSYKPRHRHLQTDLFPTAGSVLQCFIPYKTAGDLIVAKIRQIKDMNSVDRSLNINKTMDEGIPF